MSILAIVIDTETTGFDNKEGSICEIGMTPVLLDDAGIVIESIGDNKSELCDPGMKIPPACSAVHHILDADVPKHKWWPETMRVMIREITQAYSLSPSYIVAHNADFERQWISEDDFAGAKWVCTYKAARRIWPEADTHSNFGILYTHMPACFERERLGGNAHRAGPDTYATACNLAVLLEHATMEEMASWADKPILLHRIEFGKHKGTKFAELPADYLDWLKGQKDMDKDVKFTAREELKRRADERERKAREEKRLGLTDDEVEYLSANKGKVDLVDRMIAKYKWLVENPKDAFAKGEFNSMLKKLREQRTSGQAELV